MSDNLELYKKYRPKLLKEVIGQPAAVQTLKGLIDKNKVPRALLFTGPSGCGKTTLARILKDKVGCTDANFFEQNTADDKGIDVIREIKRAVRYAPIGGKCKIWLLDEVHGLTSPAQNAFLKILEDTPNHVYFFLATTNPNKLLPTIKTRCTEIRCSSIGDKDLEELVRRVAEAEEIELTDDVVAKIVDVAEESARKALVLLHQISEIEDEEEQLSALEKSTSNIDAIELARLLCKQYVKWPEVAKLIKRVNPTDEDAERIRRMVLGYYNNVLLGGGKLSERAFMILDSFRDNWFDCGKVGLTLACYEVIAGGK